MMSTYRVSALASAAVRLWRGWTVIVPVVIANALLQALLVWPAFTYDSGWYTLVSAVVSAVVFLLAYGLVGVAALGVPSGRVGWKAAWAALRIRLAPYSLWAVLLLVVVAIGLAFYTVPGLLVLAATPFLLLASLDGRRNPLAVNFRTIGRRFWRWLVTMAITGVGVLVGSLAAGFTAFFWRGGIASALVWLVAGLLLAWVTVAWALIYRSAWPPVGAPVPADPPLPVGGGAEEQ